MGGWQNEIFSELSGQLYLFFFCLFLIFLFDWIMLILVRLENLFSPCTLQMSLTLKLMMSQVIQGTWICMGEYGWFSGEWMNMIIHQGFLGCVPFGESKNGFLI